jgi:hypothetical protein
MELTSYTRIQRLFIDNKTIFSFKSEKTNYHLRDVSSGLYLPKPRTNSMKNSFMYTTEQTFGILYQKELGKASHFLPFEIKSLLTLVLGNLCKYNLPVNSSKHLLYLLNLYITVNSLAYHYLHILHVLQNNFLAHASRGNQLRLTGSAWINKVL